VRSLYKAGLVTIFVREIANCNLDVQTEQEVKFDRLTLNQQAIVPFYIEMVLRIMKCIKRMLGRYSCSECECPNERKIE
jgi:hypothetical protein